MINENRIFIVRTRAVVENQLVTVAKSSEEAIDKAEESLMDDLRDNGANCVCGNIDTVFCESIHPLSLDEILKELKE